MNLRKLQKVDPDEKESVENKEEIVVEERPKRTRKKQKPEKEKSPLSGFLAVCVLVVIGLVFAYSQLGDSSSQVKGSQTIREKEQVTKEASQAATAIKGRFEERLDSIKDQVEDLRAEDVVENSPQIEKIIQDLQSLQGLPKQQVKKTCQSICDSL